MYNLRIGEEYDIESILAMCKKFYEASPYSSLIEFDEDSATNHIFNIMDNGFFILATHGEDVVGMIGCFIQPHVANVNKKICSEALWWVEEEHRNSGLGVMLVRTAEEFAKLDGCAAISMSSLSTSFGDIGKLYAKLGYESIERAYIKRI